MMRNSFKKLTVVAVMSVIGLTWMADAYAWKIKVGNFYSQNVTFQLQPYNGASGCDPDGKVHTTFTLKPGEQRDYREAGKDNCIAVCQVASEWPMSSTMSSPLPNDCNVPGHPFNAIPNGGNLSFSYDPQQKELICVMGGSVSLCPTMSKSK